jgi:hypothetical protein
MFFSVPQGQLTKILYLMSVNHRWLKPTVNKVLPLWAKEKKKWESLKY